MTYAGPQPTFPPALRGWFAVGVLFLLYILALSNRYLVALLVGPMKRDLALSDLEISLLTGPAFGILFALASIPLGLVLDRFSRRLVIYWSVSVWSIATILCGLAVGFPALLGARALLGASQAGFGTGSYAIIGDSFPPDRIAIPMSVFVMGGTMGSGIVYLIGGPLIGALTSWGPVDISVLGILQPWQQAFLAIGTPGLLLAGLVFLLHESTRERATSVHWKHYLEAWQFVRLRPGMFGAMFVGFGIIFAAIIGIQMWTPAYFARTFHWSASTIGMSLGLAQIVGAAGMPVHGMIVSWLQRRGVKNAALFWCSFSSILAVPPAIAIYTVADPNWAVTFYCLFMIVVLASSGMGPALVQMQSPDHLRGRISALYAVISGLIAMGLGPSIVAALTDLVFKDEMALGASIITMIAIMLPLSAAIMAMGGGFAPRAYFSWR